MPEQHQSHLVFSHGSSWYAVPAEQAGEVVGFPEITRVPGAPEHLLGVFAHRGEVIPVIDLSRLAGSKPEPAKRAVLVRLPKGTLALTASRVAGVAEVAGSMEPLGSSGFQLHLRGPVTTSVADVAVIEPTGLFDFLSLGG